MRSITCPLGKVGARSEWCTEEFVTSRSDPICVAHACITLREDRRMIAQSPDLQDPPDAGLRCFATSACCNRRYISHRPQILSYPWKTSGCVPVPPGRERHTSVVIRNLDSGRDSFIIIIIDSVLQTRSRPSCDVADSSVRDSQQHIKSLMVL